MNTYKDLEIAMLREENSLLRKALLQKASALPAEDWDGISKAMEDALENGWKLPIEEISGPPLEDLGAVLRKIKRQS